MKATKATDLLKAQHKEVKTLFKKLEKAEAPQARRELLDRIAQALHVHTTIEEEIFYPAVRQLDSKKAQKMVAEAYEEHHVVKLLVAELPNVDPEDERFEAKMMVLQELVEHHAKEEEQEMFKLAQKIGKEQLQDLSMQMEARAKETMDEISKAA